MYHKMQKMVRTYKFSTWAKGKHELYRLSLWSSPWFLRPLWVPPASLRNPCMSQPQVSDELPHLKGVITAYIIHSMISSLGAPSSKIKEKSIKGKRHMKKGGKTKVKVTHVPWFLPPTFIHPSVGFPYFSYPCTVACDLEPSSDVHSIPPLYHMPPIAWWIYHGHVTPFRGRNHLIGLFISHSYVGR